jgi:hypothetical protein
MAIRKQINVHVDGKSFVVKFPNVGQLMDIETYKMGMTNNTYPELLRSGLNKSYVITELVDAVVHFMVLLPEVVKDFNVKNYNDLDPIIAKKLLKPWREEIKPWMDELMKELMRDEEIEIPNVEDVKEGQIDL